MILSLLLMVSLNTWANIVCSHPQACNLAQHLFLTKVQMNSPIPVNFDHHSFEPTSNQIKEFMGAKVLISAPLDFQPWMKKVIDYRTKKKLPLFVIEDPKKDQPHFWFSPGVICENLRKLETFLKEQNYPVQSAFCETIKLKKFNYDLVILSHNALEPFLTDNGVNVLSLKDSSHHAEINMETMKKLSSLPTKILWVSEKQNPIPEKILRQFKKNSHQVITFDVDGTIGEEPYNRLKSFLKILGE